MVKCNHLPICLISNNIALIREANNANINRIMIDLETAGKTQRQANTHLFIANHDEKDILAAKKILTHSKLMVRINPLHENSQHEINQVIAAGADIIMLPCFYTAHEVADFISLVDRRTKTNLLLETKAALENINDIVRIHGIDEIHIGLNDLCLSLGSKTIFDVLLDGTIDMLAEIIKAKNIQFGFGGVAPPSATHLPINPEHIIAEQIRLDSQLAIFSRRISQTLEQTQQPFQLISYLKDIQHCAFKWQNASKEKFTENFKQLQHENMLWQQKTLHLDLNTTLL